MPPARNETDGATNKAAVAGAVTGGIVASRYGNAREGAVIGAVLGTIAGAPIEKQGQREAREKAVAGAQRKADEFAQNKAEFVHPNHKAKKGSAASRALGFIGKLYAVEKRIVICRPRDALVCART